MKEELTPELIDRIIFGMENQSEDLIFDRGSYSLVPREEATGDAGELKEGAYDLPPWDSVKGFQLMENFVLHLRNPIVKEGLREALSAGRGVFRNFKNVLKQRPDIERRWFAYKEREMTRIVEDWFSRILELEGQARFATTLGPEEEETEELILADFQFQQMEEGVPETLGFETRGRHREAVEAALKYGPPCNVLRAITPGNETAGFIRAREVRFPDNDPRSSDVPSIEVVEWFVLEEYRGLGLGKALMRQFIEESYSKGFEKVLLHLQGPNLELENFVEREGFTPYEVSLSLDLEHWKREE